LGVFLRLRAQPIGYPALLDNGRDLLRFLVLSPAFCPTSATLVSSLSKSRTAEML
jgi:hypothetical protein